MQCRILRTMLLVVGLLLSGASDGLLIMMPDGTRMQAQVVGNTLILQSATGKPTPARDGTYKTSAGDAIVVKGGVIAPKGIGGNVGPGTATAFPPIGTAPATQPSSATRPPAAGSGAPAGTLPAARSQTPLTSARPLPVGGGGAVKSVTIDQIASEAQFNALANDTLLDVGGRQVRKAELVAEFDKGAAAGVAGAAAIRAPGLAAAQARFKAEENAAIAASAADVRRRVAEIRAEGGAR